jgi:hypothetical protein
MLAFVKRLGVVGVLGVAALGLSLGSASAQFRSNNTITSTSTNTFGNNASIGNGPRVQLNTLRYNPMMSNPYNPSSAGYTCYGYCPGGYSGGCYGSGYGYGGYGGSYGGGYGGYEYCQDPYNGFLTGAASVITSQSQFVTARRQAQVIEQQARQAAVDTQRKIYDEWKYEKNDQPTLEQIRREAIEQAYRRAVFHPPINDIWTADALNRIFDHAARIQGRGIAGKEIALDEETLKRLNFSTGVAGNIGALKDKGKLSWPSVLNRRDFAKERERFNHLAEDAYRQGSANNKVDQGTLEDMDRDLRTLDEKLTARIHDETPDDYIVAKRYLDDLRQAIKILKRPDVAKHLSNEYAVSAKTVGELVKNMANAGVRFAPAREGEEWAYNSLYKALASYDLGLAEKAGSSQ